MKKIIAIVIAVVMVVAGLGGFAYAQTAHQPMTGQKLVGWGQFGGLSGTIQRWMRFYITNPDCVNEITIEQISIIRDDGTVIYEGPFLIVALDPNTGWPISRTPLTEPLKPHQGISFVLGPLMKDPATGQWLNGEQIRNLEIHEYTVEVFWSGSKKGSPLIGEVEQHLTKVYESGEISDAMSGVSMVNMEQVLPKSK